MKIGSVIESALSEPGSFWVRWVYNQEGELVKDQRDFQKVRHITSWSVEEMVNRSGYKLLYDTPRTVVLYHPDHHGMIIFIVVSVGRIADRVVDRWHAEAERIVGEGL